MKKVTIEYYSLEETYLMALRCVEDFEQVTKSLMICRDEENFCPFLEMVDFIEHTQNPYFAFELHEVDGETLYTWKRSK